MHHQLNVKGMTCQHCKAAITRALQELDPRAHVQIDLTAGLVSVESHSSLQELRAAIEEAGYEVSSAS